MKIAVGCTRWGQKFRPDYVNVLHRAVRANMRRQHRFFCMTDDPTGLDPDIDVLSFPDLNLPMKNWSTNGNWGKIGLFAPGKFADDEIVIYFDLDVMIVGSLDPLADLTEAEPGFHHLEEWAPGLWQFLPHRLHPDQGGQGSVLCFRAAEQRHVYAAFTADPEAVLRSSRGDRSYWNRVVRDPKYLPHGWCVSFKIVCLRPWPLNLVTAPRHPPPSARVLVFHGRPRPTDVMGAPGARWGSKRRSGDRPVPWVVDYWTGYGGRLPED